jgi:serine/threonine protein kinase
MRDVAGGRVVHGHALRELLGAGRFGEVWRAEYLGQPVALKIFRRGRPVAELRREAAAQYALGRLPGADGRWFPRVEHVDLEADPPYLRMEFLPGEPLEDFLAARPDLPLSERFALAGKVLEALAAIHRNGFVHGDLSARNVLVTSDGDVRLIDVGYGGRPEGDGEIALSGEASAEGGVASPLYSAPERFDPAAGGCGPAADVFSFGKLFYRIVSGQQPFAAKPLGLRWPELGARWDGFLYRCLEERAAARFADAGEALAEFRRRREEPDAPAWRTECPECRESQTPQGERFPCRRCGRELEILLYDPASRYAAAAIVSSGRPPAPPAPPAGPPSHRGGEGPSFVLPAVLAGMGYFLFWLPGAILNWYFLEEARRVRRETGRTPAGTGALRLLQWLFVWLPFFFAGGICLLVAFGFFLLALFA